MHTIESIDIELLKQGNQKEFTLLVDVFANKIYHFLFLSIGNQKDAEDLTQEVFTAVFLNINGFKNEAKLSTWIYKIAINKYKEFLRKKNRKKRLAFIFSIEQIKADDRVKINDVTPEKILEEHERIEIFQKAILLLPYNQQLAFSLHKIDGLNHHEIAELLNLSISAVESLIFRAKNNLKDSLAAYYRNDIL
jgi:RNA polymerase sigma-70 factor (ECF subfamily)